MAWGTLAVPDTIRSAHQNILDFGEKDLADYINLLLAAHNAITREMLSRFVMTTTERIRGYGGSSGMVMVTTNEFGRADASKPSFGGNIGLPMTLKQMSYQMTRKWLQNHTPMELVAVVNDARLVDTQFIQKEIKEALFGSSNYTFKDKLVDNYALSVKRLANADGFDLPPGPNGESFDGSSHTHYAATSSLTASNLDSLVTNVAEHYNRGQVALYINKAQETTVRGFTAANQFIALTPSVIVQGNDTVRPSGPAANTSDIYNRQIGYWGSLACPVWVKPWVPASYILAIIEGAGTTVLAWRERDAGSGGLTIAADNEQYPLRAETMEREYGLGVIDRLAAAVLYTGGGSYVDPTF